MSQELIVIETSNLKRIKEESKDVMIDSQLVIFDLLLFKLYFYVQNNILFSLIVFLKYAPLDRNTLKNHAVTHNIPSKIVKDSLKCIMTEK